MCICMYYVCTYYVRRYVCMYVCTYVCIDILYEYVVTPLFHYFIVIQPSDLKRRIESLIERDYMKRDDNNSQMYHYVA